MVSIIVQIVILFLTLISAWCIAMYQMQEGRKLNTENLKVNEENAGKNRTIYDIEVMSSNDISNLKIKLSSGDYTILNAFAHPSSGEKTVIVIGKIKP